MAKKLVKMIRCRYVCYYNNLSKESLVSSYIRQNVSNICQSISAFLAVHCDKIFKLFTGILFFYNITVQCLHRLRSETNEDNIQVLKVDRRPISFFKPFFRDR